MKRQFFPFIALLVCLSIQLSSVMAQPCCLLDLGIFNNPAGTRKLEIRIRTTMATTNGNYSNGVFVVRYPSSYGVTLSVASSDFGYFQTSLGTSGGFTYYAYSFGSSNLVGDWANQQEIVVAVLDISGGGTGVGTFELTMDAYAEAANNGAFYQELFANGQSGGGAGQQGIFYQPSTLAPLPVELLEFNATAKPDRTANLDWTSATEQDLAYYGVEYSADGRKFSELGQVEAKGTTTLATDYTYVHLKPQSGLNYYRLRLVNRDGSFDYSPIRSIQLDKTGSDFSLVPTPTKGPLSLLSKNLDQYPAGLRYQLTDNSGKILLNDNIINEKTDFNLSAYAPGFYYLTVFSDREQVKQFKVVVTRD